MSVPGLDCRLLVAPVAALLLGGCASLGGVGAFVSDHNPFRDQRPPVLRGQAWDEDVPPEERLARRLVEGDYHLRQGDLQRAVVTYYDAARLDPEAVDPRLRLAHLKIRANPERAEREFDALTRTNPELAPAWFGLGLARLARSDLEGAKLALVRSLEIYPDAPDALSALGAVYDRLGRHADARQELERAIELRPDDGRLLNNLGVSHLIDGAFDEAERLLRRASELAPSDPATHNNLGLCLGLQERYDEALEAFRHAGDEQAAQSNLAYVYWLNGRPAEAASAYERALLVGGEHDVSILKSLRRVRAGSSGLVR